MSNDDDDDDTMEIAASIADAKDRMSFARAVTVLVITPSARAVEQALDPEQTEMTVDALRNYTNFIRKMLDEIDGMVRH